ncbi:MAG: hypothetical protein JWQ04_1225, partial [Pedosphaera sp.]|nr:hypothetical protein [Pedosphaera sp.]
MVKLSSAPFGQQSLGLPHVI